MYDDATQNVPDLLWMEQFDNSGYYRGGYYAVTPPYDQYDDMISYVRVESREEGLLYLVEEYVLNFVLPLWDSTTNLLNAEPTAIGCWRRYGQDATYEDIVRWSADVSPNCDVDSMIQQVASELWRRMMENGGWHGKLTMLSWRCVQCNALVESMAPHCQECGERDYHGLSP